MSQASPSGKWTPSTIASSLITRSKPGRLGSTAASSMRPSAGDAPSVSGRSAAIQSNSSGPLIAGDLVERGVDEGRLRSVEERLGDLDILVDRHLGRHIAAPHDLERAGPQDRPRGRVDALQAPALGEPTGDRP